MNPTPITCPRAYHFYNWLSKILINYISSNESYRLEALGLKIGRIGLNLLKYGALALQPVKRQISIHQSDSSAGGGRRAAHLNVLPRMATFILLLYLPSDEEEQVHQQPDSGILLSAQADSSCWGSLTTGQSERRFSCLGERQHFTAMNGRPAALSTCTCGYEAWVRVSGVFVPLCLM